MTSLILGLRLAVRRFVREPGFAVPAIATVAIGIGIAASVFALVDGVLLRPLPYPDSGRLVSIRHVAPGTELTSERDKVSLGVLRHYRDRNRVFERISAYREGAFLITDAGSAERIRGTWVFTPDLFSVLRVVPQLGRLPTASDLNLDTGTIGVLLSHDLWVRRYDADPDVIGHTIEISGGGMVAVVTGVAPRGFSFPHPETQAWFVDDLERRVIDQATIRMMGVNAIARLRPGITLEEAEADLNRLVQLLPEAFPDVTVEDLSDLGLRARLRPFKDEIVGDVRLTLLLVLASGGFLLLVTWANVANLLLLRTHRRRVEIGITRALGASEGNIARSLLSESLLLTVTGGLLGLGLARLAVRGRFGFTQDSIPRLDEVEINAAVIGLVVTLALVSGAIVAGICFASTRQRAAGPVLSALRSRSATQGREGQTGRRILVAAQMALALTLLVGSGLMARTFWRLQQVDLGFRPENRLMFYLPVGHFPGADYHDFARLHDQVLSRLRAVPGVDAVEAGSTNAFPLTLPERGSEERWTQTVAPVDAVASGDESWHRANFGYATPGYFQAMGIPLVAGRTFRSQDTSPETSAMIISQSLARDLFGDADPIGRSVEFVDMRMMWGTESVAVVGVAGDVPGTTLRAGGARAMYFPLLHPPAADAPYRHTPRQIYVVQARGDLASLVPELRRAVNEVDPGLTMLDIASLKELVAGATAQERIVMRLLLVSAGTALFLGAVGIYGVLAYAVRRRTAEIGIRLALGASPLRVTRLVVSQGAALSVAGIAAGLVAAVLLTRFIASLLYETSPTDPATFAGMTVLLLGMALVASYIPARRASRIDPAEALRAE